MARSTSGGSMQYDWSIVMPTGDYRFSGSFWRENLKSKNRRKLSVFIEVFRNNKMC